MRTALAFAFLLASRSLTAEAPPEEVRLLVEQLAAPDYAVRDQAQRRLRDCGSAAKSALLSVLDSEDVEQRMRAEYLLSEIRRSELWTPSLVRLERRSAPNLDIFRAIAEQTGNPINWERTPKSLDRRIDVDWDGVSYWAALDDASRKARVVAHLYDDPRRGGVVLSHGDPGSYPTSYSGPLRLKLLSARRNLSESLNYGDELIDRQELLELSYALHWEQRFALCRYGGRPRILEATTDAGEDLRIERQAKFAQMPAPRRKRQLAFSSRLRSPSKPARRLKTLRIELELDVAGAFHALEIDRFDPGARAEHAGYALELLQHERDANRTVLAIRWVRPLPYDKINASDMADEYVEVLDAAGASLPFTQHQVLGDRWSVKYVLHVRNKHGEPASMRFSVALLRSARSVEFTFHDVPLPYSRP